MTSCHVAFSPRYDITVFGLEKLHPFDGAKYGKAWRQLEARFGEALKSRHVEVDREATRDELLTVHTSAYLASLRDSQVLARALELPPVEKVPGWLVDRQLLRPMRWATRGTYLASRSAMEHGLAVNLSGGYHHAKRESAEGFTIYSDVAIAIEQLRSAKELGAESRVAIIDLDAHQSNGLKSIFEHDPRVAIFDVFNHQIYPPDRFDLGPPHVEVKVDLGIGTEDYLGRVREALPRFLAAAGAELAFYVAGTDIYEQDPLGGMGVSFEGVVERDLFVADQLIVAGIPAAMVLGGGYTEASHRMIASAVGEMIERW